MTAMTISFRFNINDTTLPTKWTFPQIGWKEGAQVVHSGRALSILEEGRDRQDDWYSPGRYPFLFIIKHSGCSGHSEMGYLAVTEKDVKEVYVIDREEAECLASDGADPDNLAEILLKKARKIEIDWVDPEEGGELDFDWGTLEGGELDFDWDTFWEE